MTFDEIECRMIAEFMLRMTGVLLARYISSRYQVKLDEEWYKVGMQMLDYVKTGTLCTDFDLTKPNTKLKR